MAMMASGVYTPNAIQIYTHNYGYYLRPRLIFRQTNISHVSTSWPVGDHHPSMNPYQDEDLVHRIVLVWTAIILVFGVVGNVLVIAAVWLHRNLRNTGNTFVVNLAVADIGVSLFINSFAIVGIETDGRFFIGKDWLCELLGVNCITSCACSIWTIAAIGLNRYIHICHWAQYHIIYTKKHVIIMIAFIWVFSFFVDLPNIIGWGDHRFDWKTMMCTGDMAFDKSYTIFFSFFAFGAPLLVIIFSYVRIYMYASRSSGTLTKVSAQNGRPINRASDLRLARSILVIIVVFIAMWAPYALIVVINYHSEVGRNTYIFTILLAHTNSCVNCVLYAATNKHFREGYMFFLSLLVCRRVKASKMVKRAHISVSQGNLNEKNRL